MRGALRHSVLPVAGESAACRVLTRNGDWRAYRVMVLMDVRQRAGKTALVGMLPGAARRVAPLVKGSSLGEGDPRGSGIAREIPSGSAAMREASGPPRRRS